MAHKFHPWEGGEGKVTSQYASALKQMAIQEMKKNNYNKAKAMLLESLVFPHNLGEGKLEGAQKVLLFFYKEKYLYINNYAGHKRPAYKSIINQLVS